MHQPDWLLVSSATGPGDAAHRDRPIRPQTLPRPLGHGSHHWIRDSSMALKQLGRDIEQLLLHRIAVGNHPTGKHSR